MHEALWMHTDSDYVSELLKDRKEVASGKAGEVVIAPKLKFQSRYQTSQSVCALYEA